MKLDTKTQLTTLLTKPEHAGIRSYIEELLASDNQLAAETLLNELRLIEDENNQPLHLSTRCNVSLKLSIPINRR